MIRNLLIFCIYLPISDVQGRIFSLARDKHLNVWIPYTLPPIRGNCSKPKIDAFPDALRLQELVHVLFSTYHTAGRREAIVSTSSPLLDRFMIKVWTQYAVNSVGILVAYLGRSAIKLLAPVPLISTVRFVYQDLIFGSTA